MVEQANAEKVESVRKELAWESEFEERRLSKLKTKFMDRIEGMSNSVLPVVSTTVCP